MRPSLDGFWSTLSRLVGRTIRTLVCRVLSELREHGKWLVNFLIAIFWLSLYQPSQMLAFSSCTLMWVQSQRLNLNSKALNGYTLQPTLLGTAQPKEKTCSSICSVIFVHFEARFCRQAAWFRSSAKGNFPWGPKCYYRSYKTELKAIWVYPIFFPRYQLGCKFIFTVDMKISKRVECYLFGVIPFSELCENDKDNPRIIIEGDKFLGCLSYDKNNILGKGTFKTAHLASLKWILSSSSNGLGAKISGSLVKFQYKSTILIIIVGLGNPLTNPQVMAHPYASQFSPVPLSFYKFNLYRFLSAEFLTTHY